MASRINPIDATKRSMIESEALRAVNEQGDRPKKREISYALSLTPEQLDGIGDGIQIEIENPPGNVFITYESLNGDIGCDVKTVPRAYFYPRDESPNPILRRDGPIHVRTAKISKPTPGNNLPEIPRMLHRTRGPGIEYEQ